MDPRPLYTRALDQLEKVFAGITPAELDRPTPCAEYDLRALLGHVIGGIHRIAYVGEGGRALDVFPAVDQIDDAEWSGALGRARARALAAWADDATLDRIVEVWGAVPGRMALGGYVMEAVTHTWDITRAVTPDIALDEELALVSLGIAEKALPVELSREGLPFGPLQEVPADADAHARLAGWLGRSVALDIPGQTI